MRNDKNKTADKPLHVSAQGTLTRQQYDAALKQLEILMRHNPAPLTAEADRLEALVAQIEQYEALHIKLDPVDPIEAIRFRMEQERPNL